MIGAVIPGRLATQASATCARGTCRSKAMRATLLDDHPITGSVKVAAELVCLAAGGLLVPVTGEPPSGERTPGDDADSQIGAQRQHLPLLFPVEHVVVVLHGHERGEASHAGEVVGLGELPSVHR